MRTVAFLAMIALLVVANCYATCLVNPHSAAVPAGAPPCHQQKAPAPDEAGGCTHDVWKEQRAAQDVFGDSLIACHQPQAAPLAFFSSVASFAPDGPAAPAGGAPLCLRI
ncbi:MAG: hypothetical protein K2X35_15800 [Bryobacteraceae bacterium]|nr:hypothetical protein [Bryobacteraceae bacterium]